MHNLKFQKKKGGGGKSKNTFTAKSPLCVLRQTQPYTQGLKNGPQGQSHVLGNERFEGANPPRNGLGVARGSRVNRLRGLENVNFHG